MAFMHWQRMNIRSSIRTGREEAHAVDAVLAEAYLGSIGSVTLRRTGPRIRASALTSHRLLHRPPGGRATVILGRVRDRMASWNLHDIFGRLPDGFRLQPRTSLSRSSRAAGNVRDGFGWEGAPNAGRESTADRHPRDRSVRAPVPGHASLRAWSIR